MRRRPRSTLKERSPIQLELPGEFISVRVRESSRARTARILVRRGRSVEIVVPRRASDEAVRSMLTEKGPWIADKLRVSREMAARPAVLGLDQPGVVHLAGRAIRIERRCDLAPRAVLRGSVLVVGGKDEVAGRAVQRWYRREASQAATRLVAEHASRLRVAPNKIAIRDPATRWGSCSSRGTLSFSWRLVLAPASVFEYVVVHELCHLIELNHSRAFWRLLDSAHPTWRTSARWLQDHGHELHAYDP